MKGYYENLKCWLCSGRSWVHGFVCHECNPKGEVRVSFKYKDDHYIWALQNKENGLLRPGVFEKWMTQFFITRNMARLTSAFFPDYKVVKVTLEYHIEDQG